jgi:hypothetical protein
VRRVYAVIATLVVALVACGGSPASNDAEQTLAEALDALEGSDGVTLRFTLRSTPASLQTLARDDGNTLSGEDAQKILDSSLTVSSALNGGGSGSAQLVLNVAGSEDLELRTTKDTIYVRADVRSLLEAFGQDPALADRFVAQAGAAGFDFAVPLVLGEWLAITGFEELAGRTQSTPLPDQDKVLAEIARALEASTTVTSEGRDGAGEHLVADLSLRAFYDRLRAVAAELGPGVGPAILPDSVPDEDVRLDLWVDDGRLTQVEFDLLQLRAAGHAEIPQGVERLALRVEVSDFSGDVEAPAGAVPVDLSEIVGGMLGAASQAGGAAASP